MNISFEKKFLLFLLFCFLIYLQGILNLPVLDRDEARFVTASKTMILSEDFIDIKMVEEKRYKKPIGIYWFQVVTNLTFGDYPYDKIWIYRIPSILGIFFSFILIFFSLKRLETKITSFLTVVFLIFSILVISEIHQAKTDALLFLFISICNLIIYKIVKEKKKSFTFFFWISLAIGILIKGPIILIFTFVPLLIFSILKKKNYFCYLWSIGAFSIFLLISIPWFILINIKSGGLFWSESVGNDLFNKVKAGQESHGFPPGYYSLLIFLFFWPGCIFVLNTIKNIKLNLKKTFREDDYTFYLIISFIIPFLIFELIPTKLPHYVFPSYLPLSILVARNVEKANFSKELLNFSSIPLILFPISILGTIIFAIFEYSHIDKFFLINSAILTSLILALLWFRKKNNVKNLIIFSAIFQITTFLILVFFLIPKLDKFWISKRINNIITKYENDVDQTFTFGFNEPSLLFLTSHKAINNSFTEFTIETIQNKKILLIVTGEFLKNIDKQKEYENFKVVDQFSGFNYSRGHNLEFKVFKN